MAHGLTSKITYEYACKGCGESITLRRAVDDRDEPVSCENCGSDALRKFQPTHFTINNQETSMTDILIQQETVEDFQTQKVAELEDNRELHVVNGEECITKMTF